MAATPRPRLRGASGSWGGLRRGRRGFRAGAAGAVSARMHIVECVEVVWSRHFTADAPGTPTDTCLTHSFGKGGQLVVFCWWCRETPLATQHLPATRNRDPHRMFLTEVPGMRFIRTGQRPDHCRRLDVDEGQGSHRRTGAGRSAALSRKLHATEISRGEAQHRRRHALKRCRATPRAHTRRTHRHALNSRHAYRTVPRGTRTHRSVGRPSATIHRSTGARSTRSRTAGPAPTR